MGIFRQNLKEELRQLIETLNKPSFQIPDDWYWNKKKIQHFREIEEIDLEIIRLIKDLHSKAWDKNPRLTRKIIYLAKRLLSKIEGAISKNIPDNRTQIKEARLIDEIISGLADLTLTELNWLNQHALDSNLFWAFFGTTIENFKTCAFLERGNVYFDKRKEMGHIDKSLQFVYGFSGAAYFAIRRSIELGHEPAIIAGLISKEYYGNELPEGILFPVKKLWIIKPSINYKLINVHDASKILSYFVEVYPKRLL